jgi:hypothetical protein
MITRSRVLFSQLTLGAGLVRSSRRRLATLFALLIVVPAGGSLSAERHWQTGTWRASDVMRKTIDFGPGGSSFDGGGRGQSMKAMADVHTYTIETKGLLINLEDVVPIGKKSIDVTIGEPVTFALEKNTVYVKDAEGKEHKLKVTKKIEIP